MSVSAPASIVALLPFFLQLLEKIIEKIGILGKGATSAQLKLDKRPVMQATFVNAGNASAVLEAIWAYFEWNRKGNEIITSHFSFFLSLIFAAMESSKQTFKIEGVYAVGLIIVFVSFVVFVRKLLTSAAGAYRPFSGWGLWTWVMFAAIIAVEAWEHL